ncbi:MAG: preprotein translocase subunit SecG [Rikenellaceae bacterium]
MTIYLFIIVLIMIAAVLLVLAVLAQHPKGGMAANFGASNQVMGVRQTADFLERFTWGAAIAIVVLSVMATMFIPKDDINSSKTRLENTIQNNSEKAPQFALPEKKEAPAAAPASDAPATDAPATEVPAEAPKAE